MVDFEQFKKEWLDDIEKDAINKIDKGRRFSYKVLRDWLDLPSDDYAITYYDGKGDGGIDIAYSHNFTDESGDDIYHHYIIQSKYGNLSGSILEQEADKIFSTIDGENQSISEETKKLVEKLQYFIEDHGEHDKLILVFATENNLNDVQQTVINTIQEKGRDAFGDFFQVNYVSIEKIYQRIKETQEQENIIKCNISVDLLDSSHGLYIGSVKLFNLYKFLENYKNLTHDIDQIYEKNVRRFLGLRGKVNKSIKTTILEHPEMFGLYNNGITIVVNDIQKIDESSYCLVNPYIVNGCQTTRTIWEVLEPKLSSDRNKKTANKSKGRFQKEIEDLSTWKIKADKGFVITKIVKIGGNESGLTDITRYTNNQNKVTDKDFLALNEDFRKWSHQMMTEHNIFLEIQRGGWDSQKARQKQFPDEKQYTQHANAFDLIKVYGAGWLGEAGLAFNKNPPFLPNGIMFKKIISEGLSVKDLYACYLLKQEADKHKFGKRNTEHSRTRGPTRFLFYMTVIQLIKSYLIDANLNNMDKNLITTALLGILHNNNYREFILESALQIIDSYMNEEEENCIFKEPAYKMKNNDLNAYLAWDKFGKDDDSSPKYRVSLNIQKGVMKRAKQQYSAILEMVKLISN